MLSWWVWVDQFTDYLMRAAGFVFHLSVDMTSPEGSWESERIILSTWLVCSLFQNFNMIFDQGFGLAQTIIPISMWSEQEKTRLLCSPWLNQPTWLNQGVGLCLYSIFQIFYWSVSLYSLSCPGRSLDRRAHLHILPLFFLHSLGCRLALPRSDGESKRRGRRGKVGENASCPAKVWLDQGTPIW